MRVFILIILVLLSSCDANEPQPMVEEIVANYYDSLVDRDLEGQLEILAPFSVDPETYWDSFLSYVEGGELHGIEVYHEDELLIMVELDFTLYLSESFPDNTSLKSGENRLQRYFSFFKKEDYKLKEILNKAIF